MNGENLIIEINWAYFLGIVGSLVVTAWYTGSRFTKVETNVDWLIKGIGEIKDGVKDIANNQNIAKDNKRLELIGNASPIRLLTEGERVLSECGMKEYVDKNEDNLHTKCGYTCDISAYEIQERVFDLFDNLEFDDETDKKLKDFAYAKGINIETIRRIGAIYFRDKCLQKCQLHPMDVDATKPKNNK